mmetsp:Transcript_143016/g.249585  ORF Transcript_143016/g.249585 Transcript_143016/m.249585 type:complete len:121 (+) Transcript_143016:258-620(+)
MLASRLPTIQGLLCWVLEGGLTIPRRGYIHASAWRIGQLEQCSQMMKGCCGLLHSPPLVQGPSEAPTVNGDPPTQPPFTLGSRADKKGLWLAGLDTDWMAEPSGLGFNGYLRVEKQRGDE